MRRILLVLSVGLVIAAMVAVSAVPAFADQGGIPNQNACQGQIISTFASDFGLTPPEAVELIQKYPIDYPLENPGDLTQAVREGHVGTGDLDC